jgi:3-oxoacyl-[acyl-carrier-protein] synthase-1
MPPNPLRSWQLRVTNTGLACSLGLDAPSACAAAHAGLSRATVLRSINAGVDVALAGELVVGHTLPCGRAEGFVGFAKALLLGRLAIEDLASRQDASGGKLGNPVALYLALNDRHLQDRAANLPEDLEPGEEPEPLPSIAWHADATRLAARLAAEPAAQRLGVAVHRVLLGGHSALAHALDDAASHLSAGRIGRAVVVAVDCLVEPRELRAAALLQRLKTAERPVGFIPGEAGVCFTVELAHSAAPEEGCVVVGGLGRARTASDAPAHERGRALAQAMREAAACWPDPPQDGRWNVAAGLNGEPHRADEWGHCVVAWQAARSTPLPAPECIAAAIGECGTAGPAAQIALILHRVQRGWRPPQPTLMPLSSDDGDQAALVVH